MPNQTNTVARRRISTLATNRTTNFNFVKENKGSITFSKLETGAIKCNFKTKDGKSAFAFGRNFRRAYTNMIGLYNLKYAV